MADKDKKSGQGETLAFLAVAAVVTAALYAIANGVWKWATANRKRAWVCVPIFLFPWIFLPLQLVLMFCFGAFYQDTSGPMTPEEQFLFFLCLFGVAVFAFAISLLISRRVVRKIDEDTIHLETIPLEQPEKANPAIVVKEEADYSKPPYYRNPKKWFSDNFFEKTEMVDHGMDGWEPETFLYYKGPDLSKFIKSGPLFKTEGQFKTGEKVECKYSLITDLEGNMNLWNCYMAYSKGKKPPRCQ